VNKSAEPIRLTDKERLDWLLLNNQFAAAIINRIKGLVSTDRHVHVAPCCVLFSFISGHFRGLSAAARDMAAT